MRRIVLALVAVAWTAGCADGGSVDDPAAVAGAPPTIAIASVAPSPLPTAAPPSTSASSSTTATSPTTPAPPLPPPSLPVPVDPPPDDGSTEPRNEMGTIEIPRIGLVRPLFEGIRLSTLDLGPGHWPGTAMPGELGNVVVAGHRVSHNEDFRHIDQLAPGDEVIFSTLSGRHVYRVLQTQIVEPEAIWIVDQTAAHTATLFACHPPGSVRQRIVVNLELSV